MNRQLPTIGPMERALYLRSLPFFRELRSSDLAACAQLLEEVRANRLDVLYGPREGVPAIYLLVEGAVQTRHGDQLVRVDQAPAIAGLTELLAAQRAMPSAIVATPMLALTLESAALLDLLEDHFTIYLKLRRRLGDQLAELQAATHDHHRARPAKGWTVPPDRELDLAERLLLLQRLPIFAGVGLSVLADLIRDREESRIPAGEALWQAGDEPSSLVIVIRGALACRTGDGGDEFRIDAGDIAGAEAVLGGTPHAYEAVAHSELTVLQIDAPLLVDLAEDNFDLARCSLAYLSREVLRLQDAAAAA